MYILKYSQKIPITVETCWDFFSTPNNLKLLTPDYLGFTNQSNNEKMYAGQIMSHTLRPVLNIPFEWVSEITQTQEPYYFIDEQRLGPYKFWHHEHRFKPIPNGVEVIDLIHYQLPFGILGRVVHQIKVKHDLEIIFSYRRIKLEEMFGSYLES